MVCECDGRSRPRVTGTVIWAELGDGLSRPRVTGTVIWAELGDGLCHNDMCRAR